MKPCWQQVAGSRSSLIVRRTVTTGQTKRTKQTPAMDREHNEQTGHYFDWQSTDWGTELVNVFFFKFVFRYDSRVKAMEVDERPTEQYSDIGGLDQQIQEVDFLYFWVFLLLCFVYFKVSTKSIEPALFFIRFRYCRSEVLFVENFALYLTHFFNAVHEMISMYVCLVHTLSGLLSNNRSLGIHFETG